MPRLRVWFRVLFTVTGQVRVDVMVRTRVMVRIRARVRFRLRLRVAFRVWLSKCFNETLVLSAGIGLSLYDLHDCCHCVRPFVPLFGCLFVCFLCFFVCLGWVTIFVVKCLRLHTSIQSRLRLSFGSHAVEDSWWNGRGTCRYSETYRLNIYNNIFTRVCTTVLPYT